MLLKCGDRTKSAFLFIIINPINTISIVIICTINKGTGSSDGRTKEGQDTKTEQGNINCEIRLRNVQLQC